MERGKELSWTSRWSVFDGFARPVAAPTVSWAGVTAWTDHIEAQLRPRREAVARSREYWCSALADFGGDPTERNWASFRPLRRDREEDWSDWLAQLIEESTSGRLSSLLFAGPSTVENVSAFARPLHVEREVVCGGARADIVICWENRNWTHVEVKVGDPNLAKTYETALQLERQLGGKLAHYILLLPAQRDAWGVACTREPKMRPLICDLTWLDVARALRRTLLANDETMTWRSWAHAFCGAIEQELLGLSFQSESQPWGHSLTPSELSIAEALLADCPEMMNV